MASVTVAGISVNPTKDNFDRKEDRGVSVAIKSTRSENVDYQLFAEKKVDGAWTKVQSAIASESGLSPKQSLVDVYRFKDYFKNQAGTFRLVIGFYVDNGKTRLGNVRTSSFLIK
ncbi:hypothetical protein A2G24_00925 [Listeria monocytogenes]|uniref:Uncharacterized protein n=1 Tax=Listeria monocytogenes TaxID=1639 RepID=A0A823DDU0_LISMN|nr:hypothetical protein [Listeria monocytogenes]EAD1012188.1 hypothetical protein [Listeria monocytogenes]EAD1186095.1 hypothetical protein [Listeria monocytogenes]EAF8898014.1 hypothetical protein [Listeria monocytogenes]